MRQLSKLNIIDLMKSMYGVPDEQAKLTLDILEEQELIEFKAETEYYYLKYLEIDGESVLYYYSNQFTNTYKKDNLHVTQYIDQNLVSQGWQANEREIKK